MGNWMEFIKLLAKPILYLLTAVMVIVWGIRPLIKLVVAKKLENAKRAKEAKTDQDVEEFLKKPKTMTDRDRISKLAKSDADRAADMVKRWLRNNKK